MPASVRSSHPREARVVDQNSVSWNRIGVWLNRLDLLSTRGPSSTNQGTSAWSVFREPIVALGQRLRNPLYAGIVNVPE